jgi:translation initiation factor IF-2
VRPNASCRAARASRQRHRGREPPAASRKRRAARRGRGARRRRAAVRARNAENAERAEAERAALGRAGAPEAAPRPAERVAPPRPPRARAGQVRPPGAARLRRRARALQEEEAAAAGPRRRSARSRSRRATASSADRAGEARGGRSRDDHGGELARSMAVKANEVIKVDDEHGRDGHDQPADRPGHGGARGRGDGPHGEGRSRKPDRGRLQGVDVGPPRTAASAGRHRHGSRRPRQDLAARLHPQAPRSRGRGGRHHAAHRRLPRRDAEGHVTFLDTPGHAAFTAMRARGAKAPTSSCWWSRPTTASCRRRSRPSSTRGGRGADRRRGQQDRQARRRPGPRAQRSRQAEVIPEEWGGDTMFVNVSARTGQGIDQLLEAILLQAEMLELQAPDDRPRGPASSSNPASRRAAAPWPRCWSSAAR